MMKDFWGNDALDYETREELETKYKDKLFVTVSDKPFGDPYLLFICDKDERDKQMLKGTYVLAQLGCTLNFKGKYLRTPHNLCGSGCNASKNYGQGKLPARNILSGS